MPGVSPLQAAKRVILWGRRLCAARHASRNHAARDGCGVDPPEADKESAEASVERDGGRVPHTPQGVRVVREQQLRRRGPVQGPSEAGGGAAQAQRRPLVQVAAHLNA